MASAFKFELSQRVMVPGALNIQAVVSGRMEFVTSEPTYQLRWLDGHLDIQEECFKQAELVAAQGAVPSDLVRRETVRNIAPGRRVLRTGDVVAFGDQKYRLSDYDLSKPARKRAKKRGRRR
jgi:hypothetical protein